MKDDPIETFFPGVCREAHSWRILQLCKDSDARHWAIPGKTRVQEVDCYNLDVIISVGYRVKSQRGVEFRRWATSVLRDYIVRGYAINRERMCQLGQTVEVMKRIADHTLVALTVMIAESKPQEKELMVNLVMTFLK